MDAEISAAYPLCQQRRSWELSERRISVADMKDARDSKKSKPSQADVAAAARLRVIWDRKAKALGVTQDKIAEMLDVSQGAISQYLSGAIALNFRALLVFADALGFDPTDVRADLPEQQLVGRVLARAAEASRNPDWKDVLGFQQSVSAGSGSEASEWAEAHKLKFRYESLRRQNLKPENLAVFYAKGDSMEPRIRSGDAIMFDTAARVPETDGIYVVSWRGELYVKRAEVLEDIVFFRSDNPKGDHHWTRPKRMDTKRDPIEVLGRVRWIGSWEG